MRVWRCLPFAQKFDPQDINQQSCLKDVGQDKFSTNSTAYVGTYGASISCSISHNSHRSSMVLMQVVVMIQRYCNPSYYFHSFYNCVFQQSYIGSIQCLVLPRPENYLNYSIKQTRTRLYEEYQSPLLCFSGNVLSYSTLMHNSAVPQQCYPHPSNRKS